MRRTPLLVDTSTTFEQYIKRLSKTNKKNYKTNLKQSKGCVFTQIDYDPQLMRDFVDLWAKQTVYKSFRPKWNKPMSYMDKLKTLVMFKIERNGIEAIHFIEVFDTLAVAHPPLYDKKSPELARFAWFNTIKWCCENKVDYLNLGGGTGRNWPTLIRDRHDQSGGTFIERVYYKWAYVPKDVKDHPENEEGYWILDCGCKWKSLIISGKEKCRGCER